MASRESSRTLEIHSSRSRRAKAEAEDLARAIKEAENYDGDSSSSSSNSSDDEPTKRISPMAFEVNKAPKLERLDREDLIKFLEDYKTYLEVFEEAGADGMEPRPLKTMIKSCLLKAISRYEL